MANEAVAKDVAQQRSRPLSVVLKLEQEIDVSLNDSSMTIKAKSKRQKVKLED